MAFSLSNGGGGKRGRWGGTPMAEINIVPLVDVVLVLLIIFLITVNVMEFGLAIRVPQVSTRNSSVEELPVVSITKTSEFYLNETPANINSLSEDVAKRFPTATAVYVRADGEAPWETVARVMDALRAGKFEVRAVTRPMENRKR